MAIRSFHFALSLYGILAHVIIPTNASAASYGELAWNNAVVVIDGPKDREVMNSAKAQASLNAIKAPRPVYVFFHGSEGLGKRPINVLAEAVAKEGYIIIAPRSTALTAGHDVVKNSNSTRVAEIAYAMKRLESEPWADKSKIVFHGQSAGAIALADYNDLAVSAAVFTGFNCKYLQESIDFAKSVPVLSIQDPYDPVFGWQKGIKATYGTCKDELKGRPNSYVKELENAGHTILAHQEGPREIRKFMTERGLIAKPEDMQNLSGLAKEELPEGMNRPASNDEVD